MTPSARATILIVEDTPSMADIYAAYLAPEGHRVLRAETGEQAVAMLGAEPIDVMVLDLQLPGIGGFDVLRHLRAEKKDVGVVVMTADGSIRVAVEAMREGAYDFLVKPFAAERLRATVRNALERRRLEGEVAILRKEVGGSTFQGFIGASPAMRRIYRVIEAAAPSAAPVFITGESGTGKEVAAEALHALSPRAGKPFVAINCGAIPKDLIESELFGHTKGAFTGAVADRIGAVKQADGGTLFLDEIGEMRIDLQTKLLRFLQSQTFRPVGAQRTEKVDVRIVCATNRDPLAEVKAGRFREDLYYRLHVVPLAMPPLRERGEDVALIANALLERYAAEERRPAMRFTPDAEALLKRYPWPGNVRQLQNVLRNAVVMNRGPELTAAMLPLDGEAAAVPTPAPEPARLLAETAARMAQAVAPTGPAGAPDFSNWARPTDIVPLDEIERAAIDRALAVCDGNIAKAAALLGINPSTLYRKRPRGAA